MKREHPLLSAFMQWLILSIIVAPLSLVMISNIIGGLNNSFDNKNLVTIGNIINSSAILDSSGNAIKYTTNIEYNIDGIAYSKSMMTSYYIGAPGQMVKLYYETGNPYNVDAIKKHIKISFLGYIRIYTVEVFIITILGLLHANKENNTYKKRLREYNYNKSMMQNKDASNNTCR